MISSEIPAETGAGGKIDRFLKDFFYSGPTMGAVVQSQIQDGAKIYSDRNLVFEQLPKTLLGADLLRLPQQGAHYSALDLISIAVKPDSIVYIAHDSRIPCPAWIVEKFTPSKMRINLPGATLSVYEHRTHANETLTLSSNSENFNGECQMYLVFVQESQNKM